MVLQLSFPLRWNCNPQQQQQQRPVAMCALSKQGHRLLTSLDAASGDPTASHRLIRKFVSSSSKSVALNTLSHLLSSSSSRHSSLALPMYKRITETSWFSWNPKLVSNLIASLDKQGFTQESQFLISESIQRLGFRDRDVALFYCHLIEFFSKQGSKDSVFDYYARLNQTLLSSSTSSSLKRKAFESIINALCTLDLPHDAEEIMNEMKSAQLNPSPFEFRLIILAYGRLGLFDEMTRVINQMEETSGYTLDTICFNMVLSSYGSHRDLSEMVSWIQKMKISSIPFSIRTYNTVLNSCPTIISLLQDSKTIPLSMEGLEEELQSEEILLIRELVTDSNVLKERLEWSLSQGKLDLHGMHLGSVYVIMLQWIQELKSRFRDENASVPAEITVVCGLGKHSSIRGESPVKALVSEIMVRLKSPLKIDRKNVGCFVTKGKNVRNWLC